MRCRLLSTTLVLGLVADVSWVRGDEQTPEQLAQFALAGLKNGRSKLTSGVYRAHGKLDRSTEVVDPVVGPIEIFCAFDYNQSLMRFDRAEPLWVARGTSTTKRIEQYGGKFVSTPDMAIELLSGNSAGEITAAPRPNKAIRPFDIRMVGVSGWGTLDTRLTLDQMVDIYRRFYVLVSASADANDEYTLRWTDKAAELRAELRLDGKKEFAPVRFEVRFRNEKVGRDEWGKVINVSTVSWSRINDVWVPHVWHDEETTGTTKKRDLTFEWESVNGPVDKSLFTLEGLGAKDAMFHDRRFGKVVVVHPLSDAPAATESPRPVRSYRKVLVIALVNLVVLSGLGILWLRRRRRSRKEVGVGTRDN